jgi:hypothetical protein
VKKLFIIGLLILGLFATSSFASEYLTKSDWGTWYYDLGKQGTSANGVVYQEIYTTLQLTDSGRKGFEQPSAHTVKTLYLIDCAGNRFGSLAVSYYDPDGNRIGDILTWTKWEWKPIESGTVVEQMKFKACK